MPLEGLALFFCFILSHAQDMQGLLLALCSGIIPSRTRGPYEDSEIKLELAICKAHELITTLSFQSIIFSFLKVVLNC